MPQEEKPPIVNLHATSDASVWAREFVAMHGGDEGLMIGWFANAIMAGWDHAEQSALEEMDERMRKVQSAHCILSAVPDAFHNSFHADADAHLRDAMGGAAWNPRSNRGWLDQLKREQDMDAACARNEA